MNIGNIRPDLCQMQRGGDRVVYAEQQHASLQLMQTGQWTVRAERIVKGDVTGEEVGLRADGGKREAGMYTAASVRLLPYQFRKDAQRERIHGSRRGVEKRD